VAPAFEHLFRDGLEQPFLADGLLDELPQPVQAGASRIAGADLNKPWIRAALSAAPLGSRIDNILPIG
jgi:hypothetical protein